MRIPILLALLFSTELAPDAALRLAQYLDTDCYVEQAAKREQLLTGIPESALWDVYRIGAPAAQIEKTRAHAARAYEERQRFLRTAGTNALPKDEIARQLAVTKQEYVERRVAQLHQRYRDTAIGGLAVIGTAQSIPELERIARDETNRSQGAALAALERLRQKR